MVQPHLEVSVRLPGALMQAQAKSKAKCLSPFAAIAPEPTFLRLFIVLNVTSRRARALNLPHRRWRSEFPPELVRESQSGSLPRSLHLPANLARR